MARNGSLLITGVAPHADTDGLFVASAKDIEGNVLVLVIASDSLDAATAHAHNPAVEADFKPAEA